MNDTDRLRFVETIQRLQNWMTRTRLTPSEFLSVAAVELYTELITLTETVKEPSHI